MKTTSEIASGIVLHMDPDVLVRAGASYTCEPDRRVLGPHSFLCLAANEVKGAWVPLFSRPAHERVAISRAGRTGDQSWRLGTYYFHPGQVWVAPHSAVIDAAVAGGDRTRPGNRNRLAAGRLPVLPE